MIDSHCADCGADTDELKEWYMVIAPVWSMAGADEDLLCVGCLESRLGRQLVRDDFTDAPINTDPEDEYWGRSDRLRVRLTTT